METGSQKGSNRFETHHFETGEGRYKIEAIVVIAGRDLNITVGGGTSYHIGATALAIPRPSLDDPGLVSASASVICVTGHKDDQLARSAALKLSARFNCVVTVNAGLHIDDANADDIGLLTSNFNTLIQDIISRLA